MTDRNPKSTQFIIIAETILAAMTFGLAVTGFLAGDDTLLLFAVFLILTINLADSLTRER